MNNMLPGLLNLDSKLVDDLYVEAMVLADEARAYLESAGDAERGHLDPLARVHFSCEALKITTRLMQVIAWLLARRALARGEISEAESQSERYRLGDAAGADHTVTPRLPTDMRVLIAASESLYARTQRFEERLTESLPLELRTANSPARDLMTLLEANL